MKLLVAMALAAGLFLSHFTSWGQIRLVYRSARYDTVAHTWRRDSSRITDLYSLHTQNGQQKSYLAKSITYSFVQRDTVRMQEYFRDSSHSYLDTLQLSSSKVQGAWIVSERVRVRYHNGGYNIVNERRNVFGTYDTIQKVLYFTDGLKRVISKWYYQRVPGNIRIWDKPAIDSMFFAGTSTKPYREKFYRIILNRAGDAQLALSVMSDSVRYDSLERPLSLSTTGYPFPGELQSLHQIKYYYQGDTALFDGRKIDYSLGDTIRPPKVSRSRILTITHPDSVVSFSGSSIGLAALMYQIRSRTRTFNPRISLIGYSNHESVTDSLTSAGIWVPFNKNKDVFTFDVLNSPIRIIRYFTVGALPSYYPVVKAEIEFVSPELLTGPKPKQPRPVTLFTFKPNPVRNILTLISHEPVTRLIFMNTLGQGQEILVHNQKADVSTLSPGLYHVTAFAKGKSLGTSRVVKE